jgi:hypothetical protein
LTVRGYVESITTPRTKFTIRPYMASPRTRAWWAEVPITHFAPNPAVCALVDRMIDSAEVQGT